MAYTAMYRKFRPDTFSEVKGQDDIVRTLKNQILSERVGHAYLFCGTRGTGKTSVAKIFARAINCLNPKDGNPCNECAVCKNILSGSSMNVAEIDAASNNSVDNIREIVDEVRYSPTEGKYRVYIIDEVHMLSQGAFNALLKTLEEPPSYVVFILATTEAHKIPITMLSRCQRYDFKRIRMETIADRLMDLCGREGITAEEKAMTYLAKAADGSMRDALSLLERCVAFYYGQELTYDKVLGILGTVDMEVFAKMLRYVRDGNVSACMKLLDELVIAGRELSRFVVDFTWYMRNLLLTAGGGDVQDILEVSGEQMEILKQEAQVFTEAELMRFIGICCELTNKIRYATQKRILIEMEFMRMCRPESDTDNDAVLARIRKLEETTETLKREGVAIPSAETAAEPEEEAPVEVPVALPEDLKRIAQDWKGIVESFPMPGRLSLLSAKPCPAGENRLRILFSNKTDHCYMDRDARKEELRKLIAKMVGVNIEVEMAYESNAEAFRKEADITVLNERLNGFTITQED